jgi:hypothetical protein
LGWLHVPGYADMKSRATWSKFGFENLPYGHYLIRVGHGMPMASSESLQDGFGLFFFGEEQCDDLLWRALISGCSCGMTEGFRSGAARNTKSYSFHRLQIYVAFHVGELLSHELDDKLIT